MKVDARDAAYNLLTPTVKGAIIRGVGGELGTDVAGLGASVAGGGDINGDGFSEVIVGSPGAYNAAVSTNSGVGSVVLGGASLPSMIDLAALGYSGVRIFGQENDYAGSSVGFAGDVNNDGFDDVLVGAEGAKNGVVLNTGGAYLVLGRAAIAGATVQAKLSLSSEDPARSFFGGASGDRAGRFVGAAGDMNNDGFDDFFVGAPMASPGGKAGAGTAYLIMGQSAAAVIDWSMYK